MEEKRFGPNPVERSLPLGRGRWETRRNPTLCLLLWLAILLGTAAPEMGGASERAGQSLVLAQAGDAAREFINVDLHDLELIDQNGNPVKFKTDVIGDRLAVVIPFYIDCPASYPILIYTFTRLQDLLGPKLGKEVVLVSVTVNPKSDTPARLKAYAKKQKARPGWVFLTGDRDNLGQVLFGVGALMTPNVDDHNHIPITTVGFAGGKWRRFHGLPSPEQVMAQIEESLTAARTPGGG